MYPQSCQNQAIFVPDQMVCTWWSPIVHIFVVVDITSSFQPVKEIQNIKLLYVFQNLNNSSPTLTRINDTAKVCLYSWRIGRSLNFRLLSIKSGWSMCKGVDTWNKSRRPDFFLQPTILLTENETAVWADRYFPCATSFKISWDLAQNPEFWRSVSDHFSKSELSKFQKGLSAETTISFSKSVSVAKSGNFCNHPLRDADFYFKCLRPNM